MMEFTLRDFIKAINGTVYLEDDDIVDCIDYLVNIIDEGETLAKVVRIVRNRVIETRDD